jgi:diacylglycerol kinase family enzyme
METVSGAPDFKRVFVLRNPVSTHAAQAKQRIAEVEAVFGKKRVEVLDTVRGGVEPNRAMLRRHAHHLGPDTLLCIVAGDGTVSMVVEMLIADDTLPDKARSTVVLPLWGGNANDLAHMLNGNAYRNRVREVLTKGGAVQVRPLSCTISSAEGPKQARIAACYISFGATAFAAARLNAPDVRRNPLRRIPGVRAVADFFAGFGALRNAPTFSVIEKGKERLVYERTYANGSRFAKVERLPLKLTEPYFLEHTLEEKRISSVLPRMLEAMRKSSSSRYKNNFAQFTVQQDILAQFDGEPTEIAAGATVCITVSKQSFAALSLLL